MIEAALAFLFGLLIGSFLNVCIYRMPRDLSVVRPRSFCPTCEKPVAWYDNIPLASYVLLRGRCRHCRQPISIRYPVVEFLTAAVFFLALFLYGPSARAFKLCTFAALLIGLVFSDLEQRILPDEFTLGGVAAGIGLAGLVPFRGGFAMLFLPASLGPRWISVIEAALVAAVSGGLLWLIGELYYRIRHRDGLGLGDVKMIAMIGAFLGLQGALLAVVLGSLLGSVIGLAYIYLARKDAASYELPFGTFLGIAALALALLRERLLLP